MIDIIKHTGETHLFRTCRRTVHGLIERYEWALLPEDELVEQVLGAVGSETSEVKLERIVKRRYMLALYKACLQKEDRRRRERAYQELSCYLYRAAYNRWPELAEDATQRALILVCEQIERCREPGAFIAFALWKLRHAFQIEQRARGREGHELSNERVDQRNSARKRPPAHSRLDHKERAHVLTEALGHIPDERKRKAILLRYVEGLSDQEIGARLGVAVDYVRVLRHRGIERLRENERLRDYFDVGKEGSGRN